jgi:hypothetical protein
MCRKRLGRHANANVSDDMAPCSQPRCDSLQDQGDVDCSIFQELWQFRGRRGSGSAGLDNTVAGVEHVLKAHLRFLSAADSEPAWDEAVSQASATVRKLLPKYKHVFLPRSVCTDVSTHVRIQC